MSNAKKLPTKRDAREALGYLTDFLENSPNAAAGRAADLAKELVEHAQEVRVQRSMDRLALFFDLDEEAEGESLPEATDGDSTVRAFPGTGDLS
jgi:hypothetical protein